MLQYLYGSLEFVHVYVSESFNQRFSGYLMREMCSESSCVFTLTLQAYTSNHASDKDTAHGFDEGRRRRHMPGMGWVEKLGSQPAGSM
jgi:hypothetical protein